MARKTKKENSTASTLQEVVNNLGLLLMTASATLLMVEVPERQHPKVIVPQQPLFAVADNVMHSGASDQQRRERDEVHPHFISYGVNQRTPARSGRV